MGAENHFEAMIEKRRQEAFSLQEQDAEAARLQRQRANREAARQAEAAARQAKENKKRVKRIQPLLDAKRRRDISHEGTWPAHVLGSEAQDLCGDFIDFMADRDFPHATRLRDGRALSRWSALGYGIGGIALGYREKVLKADPTHSKTVKEPVRATNLQHNVFLCEDGQLRLFVHPSVRSLEEMNGQGKNKRPSRVLDLPLDPNGETVVPKIGYFAHRIAQEMVPIGWQESRPAGKPYFIDGMYTSTPEIRGGTIYTGVSNPEDYFVELGLEGILRDYVLNPTMARANAAT